MQLRNILIATAALAAAAGSARATEYVVIAQEVGVDAPADVAWGKVNGFCAIGGWFRTSCEIIAGQADDVGAVRRIAGRIDEVMVAKTPWSYSYAQPKSPMDYHGTVQIRPAGKNQSQLIYTLIYDAEALKTPEAKAEYNASRMKAFAGVLQTMKAQAEAK